MTVVNQIPNTPGPFIRLFLIGGNTITFPYYFGHSGFDLSSLMNEIETAKTFNGIVKLEAYSISGLATDKERFIFHTWNKEDDIDAEQIYSPCTLLKNCNGLIPDAS
jgi:hypothetical protein